MGKKYHTPVPDASTVPFKRGEVVWCEAPGGSHFWHGLAIVRSHEHERGSMAVAVNWVTCSDISHYYKHSDGCDAYVPAEWLTKVEGVEHD